MHILLAILNGLAAFLLIYVLFGVYDVSRNHGLNGEIVKRYFTGNGTFTWLLSPINTLLDLIALPYINKGVYKLEDLPPAYQQEIEKLITSAHQMDVVGQLEPRTKDSPRTMIFFKWYGTNIDTFANVPAYHEPYKYVQTIGVSVFNRKEATSKHFGPLRATLRVLYNINRMEDNTAYIEVGDRKYYWADNPLFIFDDTLQHQSVNGSDKSRYCLFVDIVRPALWAVPFVGVVRIVRFFLSGAKYVFYKKWNVIQK